MIKQHSCDVLNKVRDKAFEDLKTRLSYEKDGTLQIYRYLKAFCAQLWIEFATIENAHQSIRRV